MHYGYYANGFWFNSHLADLHFSFLYFFQAYVLRLEVSVPLGLGQQLGLGLGFIFYVYFISTKATTLSSCVTVTSHVAYE